MRPLTPDLWYALTGAVLVAIAFAAFVAHAHLVRRLLAFNVMGTGSFLVLVGLAQDGRGPDPVPQALVLTGIVVAVASTALALVLVRHWFAATGYLAMPEDGGVDVRTGADRSRGVDGADRSRNVDGTHRPRDPDGTSPPDRA
jgi:multicomponent Na+:H+ antiporter subunit C